MIRRRLTEFDPLDINFAGLPPASFQIAFGMACFLAEVITRSFVDLFSTGAGPFSLIFPAIMISTLYGRWQSGVVTFLLAYVHVWYVVLPDPYSFTFSNPTDGARTVVNGAAALLILFFAEIFQAAVRRTRNERDTELKTQNLLMRELEHRTKNNFAMVSALLTMQQRRSKSEEVRQALLAAAARVQTFAAIHQTIYTSSTYSDEILLPQYLGPIVSQLQTGLFETRQVTIVLDCDPVHVKRDRALAFGLIVNELVTNAAKHAFPQAEKGRITITYRAPQDAPWRLSVCDDGIGANSGGAGTDGNGSGLGKILLASFAQTAGGTVVEERRDRGIFVSLVEDETVQA